MHQAPATLLKESTFIGKLHVAFMCMRLSGNPQALYFPPFTLFTCMHACGVLFLLLIDACMSIIFISS